jgi:hypothetical protein
MNTKFVFADNEQEWNFVTDLGKIITPPCAPWLIVHLPENGRYAIYCEKMVYWVYADEARRLQIQSKMQRVQNVLANAMTELMKD